MILYHTGPVAVPQPDTAHSRDYLDFGKGFYLTTIHEQAVKYAERFKRRQRSAWLNTYEFAFEEGEWKVLRFNQYDREWLDFISKCRAGEDDTDSTLSSTALQMTG